MINSVKYSWERRVGEINSVIQQLRSQLAKANNEIQETKDRYQRPISVGPEFRAADHADIGL